MQQLFYMTTDGRLKEPRSGAEYEATAWPGRIVAVCPRRPGETDDEFGYLAIVELMVVSTVEPKEPGAATAQASLIARSDQPAAPSKRPAPLSV
jgi:hypothetical protein